MATPVAPIVFDETGAWRWYARTDSLRGTLDALSRVWSRVAQAAVAGDDAAGDTNSAVARLDRRVVGRAPGDEEGVQVLTRTSVLTLVVVAPRPEDVDRAVAAVATLASRHPSRTVILSPVDPDGPAAFEAQVFASCQLPEHGRSAICTEEVLIRLGGELAQHLSSTVAPLLIHDLPVVLWWPGDVPFGRPDLTELVGQVDRLFVDSGQFQEHGLEGLIGLAGAMRDDVVVHDVSWMRLMLWRELLAACFDHPLLVRELSHLTSIRVDVARPGWDARLSRAVLFVGWLMARLRLSVADPLRERPGGTWEATLRSRGREVGVTIRPVEVEFSGAARAAGSVVRAELATARPDTRTTVTITRQTDHLLATADWNGASVLRRASQLERFDEMPYLASSLDRTSHERIFAQALEMAVALSGEPGGTSREA
jgi:glucose-6-phosphate dehydrogenase assembly protein OpcA